MPLLLPTAAEYERLLTTDARRAAVARLTREHWRRRQQTRTAQRAAQAISDSEALYQAACVIYANLPREPEADVLARRKVLWSDYQLDIKAARRDR